MTTNTSIPTDKCLKVQAGIKGCDEYLTGEEASAFLKKLSINQREAVLSGYTVYLSRGRQAFLINL